jgi:hypothetical protein
MVEKSWVHTQTWAMSETTVFKDTVTPSVPNTVWLFMEKAMPWTDKKLAHCYDRTVWLR